MFSLDFLNFFHKLTWRIYTAFFTFPTIQEWLTVIIFLLILTLFSLPIGLWCNFLKFERLKASKKIIFSIVAGSLLTPAISEELFFRVLLIPHPQENLTTTAIWLWGSMSLVLFIIYHPLNGVTFFPAGRETFFNPVFLLQAAVLGIVCSVVYLQSGSLWLPVIIHWLVVVVWLLFLGGYKQLHGEV
ncbi:Abortive infection protein [[Phormidium ambiguum] IAM M-71]|uniref:Abortive infection protein n=1 Tax=[Phormidium ambiguum] IAM M-71 TaxID=454136 RepID=A0A1U7IKE8_9CYAN|nr:CPBP family glutamic-type intramembrane protease [Phormidium ambiguum]OKH37645.1 Abortive infection protein [Phormidium ambiguum IAM M-71]